MNSQLSNQVKLPKNGYCIACVAVFACILALAPTKSSKPVQPQEKCSIAHEDYGDLITSSKLGVFEKFAVASDSSACSTLGKKIFEKGGSAVDVAIATGLCNSLMNAQSMGIGGGHFMSIYLKDQNKSFTIDAREKAPLNSYPEMFINRTEKALIGGLATAIPGEIKGYWAAHKLGGKLPWKELFEPTINMCKNGFQLTRSLAKALEMKQELIRKNKPLADIFINPVTNELFKENDLIKMPNLAKTLSIIAEKGSDVFYNGLLTGLMVAEINENGGNVTIQDFLDYDVKVHENRLVIKLDDNHRVYTVPPPSSGILVSFIMKIMRGFELSNEESMSNEKKIAFYQRLAESLKHAYAKRTFLGDENYLELRELLKNLSSEEYIELTREKIKIDTTFPCSYYGSALDKTDAGTAHISVLAPNGDAVALTSTINNYLGAKYAGKYTGIIYNDCMDDFSTPGSPNSFGYAPTEANFIKPGKRALSSMSPIIVVDNNNNVRLVLGASGGSKIISAVAQVALKSLWMDTDIKTAIDARRIHHQLYPENIDVEVGFSQEIEEELIKIGHKTKCFNFGGSTVQGIQVTVENKIYAYSDPRKGGLSDGV